jgi:hypothetical protein
MERSPSSANTCLARARRERGQKRVPLPPARITGRKSIAFNIEETSYRTEITFAQGRANYFQNENSPSGAVRANPKECGVAPNKENRLLSGITVAVEKVSHSPVVGLEKLRRINHQGTWPRKSSLPRVCCAFLIPLLAVQGTLALGRQAPDKSAGGAMKAITIKRGTQVFFRLQQPIS